MAHFVIIKLSDNTITGAFSNLKYAVDCLLKVGVNTNYFLIYRKMKNFDGGGFLDLGDFRITKLSQNKVYQYQNGKVIEELEIKDSRKIVK